MTEWGVFGVIVALFGFVATMYGMFYKPTHELKIEIVKLNANFEAINERDEVQNKRLDAHSVRLDKHGDSLLRLDIDVKYLKDYINK